MSKVKGLRERVGVQTISEYRLNSMPENRKGPNNFQELSQMVKVECFATIYNCIYTFTSVTNVFILDVYGSNGYIFAGHWEKIQAR